MKIFQQLVFINFFNTVSIALYLVISYDYWAAYNYSEDS